ncbi:MAG TPA: dihydrolipoyl dehydrogenase, partial [Spirochaetia bacterium]|nr:dihydrolipoyl dehydrogenase [Spirochaetia bacterium]
PWVVYSMPEASGCGLTESDARKAGRNIKTATLQMRANGRFIAENAHGIGFCKVIADADTDVLLGVHLIGATNSEMIYGIAAMLEAELRVKEIKEIIFPHPTVSEIIKDALWELK